MGCTFTYQRFWMRVFCAVPIIFILALLEYRIGLLLGFDIDKSPMLFFLISAVIMLAIAFLFFKFTVRLFSRNGTAESENGVIKITMGKRITEIDKAVLKDVNLRKISVYGTSVAAMTVSYLSDGSEAETVIYSADLTEEDMQKSSLGALYEFLRLEIGFYSPVQD